MRGVFKKSSKVLRRKKRGISRTMCAYYYQDKIAKVIAIFAGASFSFSTVTRNEVHQEVSQWRDGGKETRLRKRGFFPRFQWMKIIVIRTRKPADANASFPRV